MRASYSACMDLFHSCWYSHLDLDQILPPGIKELWKEYTKFTDALATIKPTPSPRQSSHGMGGRGSRPPSPRTHPRPITHPTAERRLAGPLREKTLTSTKLVLHPVPTCWTLQVPVQSCSQGSHPNLMPEPSNTVGLPLQATPGQHKPAPPQRRRDGAHSTHIHTRHDHHDSSNSKAVRVGQTTPS